jgi:uncharacterized membrane protein YdjX (TVP38/TMEM64 family)
MNRGVKWTREDLHVALATVLTIGVFTGLALYHPLWLVLTVIGGAFAGMCLGFWLALRKPVSEEDRYWARVHAEQDRRERFDRELQRVFPGGGFRG